MTRFLELRRKKLYLLELTINQAGIWQGFINFMGEIINFIYNCLAKIGIENAALCIIIFTILIKALMIPMNIKQQKFSRLSSQMQPEMSKIQKKYQGKKDEETMRKQSAEMNELYEKYGVSPTGGCLPILITMPIIFALYRVIYSIPHHIDKINGLYEGIAQAIINTDVDYTKELADIASGIKSVKFPEADASASQLIDLLSNLKPEQWSTVIELFPEAASVISTNSDKIVSINQFILGMNIADWPTTHPWPGLIIPILAILVQWYQTKQMSKNTNQQMQDNPTAQSMMMMTKIMPFFSGFICLSLPIGVGIYWIVGGLFQIVQQFFVNKYMDNLDLDALIEKNREKARKRKIRMGLDPDASFAEIAQQKNKTKMNGNFANKNYDNVNRNQDKEYKKGSISSYANMVYDKKDKK